MPTKIFRCRPFDDTFSVLLAAEIGHQSGNFLLLIGGRLIGQSHQALAPQTILTRDLATKNLYEPIGFLSF
jgi:hypothetical protein